MRIPSFLRRNPESKGELGHRITDADNLPPGSGHAENGEETLPITSSEGVAMEEPGSNGKPIDTKAAATERRRRNNRGQASLDKAAKNARLLMKHGISYRR